MLQTLLEQEKYDEAMSDEHPPLRIRQAFCTLYLSDVCKVNKDKS